MRTFFIWLLHRFASLLVGASFLLSIAAVLLWQVSRSARPINFSLELDKKLIEARLFGGTLTIERTTDWPSYDMLGMSKSMDFNPSGIKRHWGVTVIPGHPVFYQIYSPTLEALGVVRGGGIIINGRPRPQLDATKIIFPGWYPLAATSIPLAIYLSAQLAKTPRRIVRARRKQKGLCLNCGYDLRESKDRCPECGRAIELLR